MNDLPRPVSEALEAANANDTAAFLACFRGQDEIREWSDREFIGAHVSLDLTGVEQEEDGATIRA
jgi:hypothetical protein